MEKGAGTGAAFTENKGHMHKRHPAKSTDNAAYPQGPAGRKAAFAKSGGTSRMMKA